MGERGGEERLGIGWDGMGWVFGSVQVIMEADGHRPDLKQQSGREEMRGRQCGEATARKYTKKEQKFDHSIQLFAKLIACHWANSKDNLFGGCENKRFCQTPHFRKSREIDEE